MKNLKAKTRPVEKPYEIWSGFLFGEPAEWRVLKHYQTPEKEEENPYARVMTAAKSAATYGSWEYGDMYISDLKKYAFLTYVARLEE